MGRADGGVEDTDSLDPNHVEELSDSLDSGVLQVDYVTVQSMEYDDEWTMELNTTRL